MDFNKIVNVVKTGVTKIEEILAIPKDIAKNIQQNYKDALAESKEDEK